MGQYLLHRLAYLVPTLFVISLIAFALSKSAPGDPVELLLRRTGDEQMDELASTDQGYRETAQILGLDKPVFYFTLLPAAYPDTLHRIINPIHRRLVINLCARYGRWALAEAYFNALQTYEQSVPDKPREILIESRRITAELYHTDQGASIRPALERLVRLHPSGNKEHTEAKKFLAAFTNMESNPSVWNAYLPGFQWFGLDNQYHHWLSNCLRGDFGRSFRDGQPVKSKVWAALRWTLILNVLSLLLAYGLSIPLGIYMAAHRDTWIDKGSQAGLFFLYALPSFWAATLLLLLFTHPDIGLQWITVTQISDYPAEAGWWARRLSDLRHMALPMFCLTYGSLAFIALQMRNAMVETLQQDYIRTARAKGLKEGQILWKHAMRNALFPAITLLGSIFPAMIAGSIVIESVFNLPGMGKLTLDSMFAQDWPVVYTILMLSAVLTIAGLLLADMLYSWADPRVRLGAENQSTP